MFTRLDRLATKYSFAGELRENLKVYVAKRRTIASRCTSYIKCYRSSSALDHRLNQTNDKGSIQKELAKFFLDAKLAGGNDEFQEPIDEDGDSEKAFEAFAKRYYKSEGAAGRGLKDSRQEASEKAKILMNFVEKLKDDSAIARFPKKMVSTLSTIVPTTVLIERQFSRAKCRND